MIKKIILALLLSCYGLPSLAGPTTPPGVESQVIINGGNNQFGAKTLFDNTYESLEIPVGPTASRPAIPVTGMFRYNTNTPGWEGFNGTSWSALVGTFTPGGSNGQIQYNNAGALGGLTTGTTVTTANTTVNTTQPADRIVASTSDTILVTDLARVVKYTNSSGAAVSIPGAASTGFTQGFAFIANNAGTGSVALTPLSGSTINGVSTFTVPTNTGCWVRSDGSNYQIDLSSCSALPITTANLPANIQYRVIGTSLGGAGTTITTGVAGAPYTVPYSGTILSYNLQASSSCSIVMDIWKLNGSPPTIVNTITASLQPTLSSSNYINSSTLTGWTTSVSANDVFVYNVNSVSGCTAATLELVIKTN